jgi:hypothetical protein
LPSHHEGEPTDDEDFDADEGALLIRPARVVDVREPDWRGSTSSGGSVRRGARGRRPPEI